MAIATAGTVLVVLLVVLVGRACSRGMRRAGNAVHRLPLARTNPHMAAHCLCRTRTPGKRLTSSD